MGLVAQVVAGFEIGQIATNAIVKYSKSQYLDKIHTLNGLFTDLGKHLNTMEGLQVRFKQIYTDGSAYEMQKELERQIKAVRTSQNQVMEQMKMWEAAIQEMEDNVKETSDKIEEIKKITDALDITD